MTQGPARQLRRVTSGTQWHTNERRGEAIHASSRQNTVGLVRERRVMHATCARGLCAACKRNAMESFFPRLRIRLGNPRELSPGKPGGAAFTPAPRVLYSYCRPIRPAIMNSLQCTSSSFTGSTPDFSNLKDTQIFLPTKNAMPFLRRHSYLQSGSPGCRRGRTYWPTRPTRWSR